MEKILNEKRAFPRVKTTLPVRINSSKLFETINGETVNLSEGGICIITDNDIETTHPFNLAVDLPPCYTSDPDKAEGITMKVKGVWDNIHAKGRKNLYGVKIIDIKDTDRPILKDVVKSEATHPLLAIAPEDYPKFKFVRVPHACNMYAIDLTIGCEHGCLYCHFSKLNQEKWLEKYPIFKEFPILVDISPMYEMNEFPKTVVYLSPSSDAFAPKARDLTHEMLSYLFPKGVIFTISTKEIIPDKTLKLLKKYNHLIEGLVIGITSLDEKRNKILEPSSPSAQERLEHVPKLLEIGCRAGVRLDPIFPGIDDTDESFGTLIKEVYKKGVREVTGTYLFSYGRFLKQMRQEPILKESLKLIKEKSYVIGGVALSVPLEMKKKMYEKMNQLCKSYGIRFITCGCKEIRLRDASYPLVCRNMDYYKNKK